MSSRTLGGVGENTTVPSEPSGERPSIALPSVRVEPAPAPQADFELGETIGAGGMGRVVAARQTALDRSVATKFLKDPSGDSSALLREAIATGRLEHPNIVPVHLLATTERGEPFFAMKRVEGRVWSELLTERSLVEHLEILSRVCDAVAFAHDRQVLHRDIKPDNVLVGSFGEVYLVDWGLAVSLRPDAVLPLASHADFAGTPAYMAPEMTLAGGCAPSQLSDVYLLGATLFEILTGRPPHRGTTSAEVIEAASHAAPPSFPPIVSSELASICRRAMAKVPADRYPSVTDLKQSILSYLRHREAHAVLEQAQQRLQQLELAVGRPAIEVERSTLGLSPHAAFTECRSAFEQVRRLWPEFSAAKVGLQRALQLMVQYELGRGEARAARILLAQLEVAPPELVRQVELAEEKAAHREVRLRELELDAREQEVDVALAEKRWFSLAFAVVVLVGGVATQVLIETGLLVPTTGIGLVVFGGSVLSAELFSVIMGRARQANKAQQRLANALRVSAWASVSLWTICWATRVEVHAAMALAYLMVAFNWGMGAVLFHRRAGVVAIAVGSAALGSVLAPRFAFVIGGVASCVGFVLLALLLGKARPARPVT